MANYEIWQADDFGNRIALLDQTTGFEYALVSGDLGWLAVKLPYRKGSIWDTARTDNQIQLYRQPPRGILELELVAFSRRKAFQTSAKGLTTQRQSGPDSNTLLDRRIVAHKSGSAQAEKTDLADDMMRAVVNEQLGSGAAAARQFTFTEPGDLGDGPSITKAFAFRNVLEALKGIQAASKVEGTEVFFAMRASTPTAFTFDTYTNQPGRDRTISTGNKPMVFGLSRGNLAAPFYEEDDTGEKSYAYAGGQGLGADRNVQEAEDADRTAKSQWGRIEVFTSTNSNTDNAVTAAANDKLARSRGITRFTAQLLSTPETPYGQDGWKMGDKVTADHLGRQFDVIIRSVHVRVGGNGDELIVANAEYQA